MSCGKAWTLHIDVRFRNLFHGIYIQDAPQPIEGPVSEGLPRYTFPFAARKFFRGRIFPGESAAFCLGNEVSNRTIVMCSLLCLSGVLGVAMRPSATRT